jgi:hypothetical protein
VLLFLTASRNASDRADVIIRRREKEQQTCNLEPTYGWRKRWLSLSKSENLSFSFTKLIIYLKTVAPNIYVIKITKGISK